VRDARAAREREANRAVSEQVGEEQLAKLKETAEEKLADLREQVAELEAAIAFDEIEGVGLPELPEPLVGEADGLNGCR
jgi:hypothetical protein